MLHTATQSPSSWMNDVGGGAVEDSGNTEAESQLTDVKNKVKDLKLKTEQSNSRAKAHIEYLEKVNKNIKNSGDLGMMSSKNSHSLEVMKELVDLKQEMSKLKLDMISLLEDKRRAEKKIEESKLITSSCSISAETLRMEIDEINEEQVLFDLARIEAVKECADIESQRIQDNQKHYLAMEKRRKQMNQLIKEIDAAKELEQILSITMEDVNVLEIARKEVKEMQKFSNGEEKQNNSNILDSITKEIETAKKELVSVKEEGFRFMASMDIIRIELKNISEETEQVKRREEKTEMSIQSLNAKLLRARAKLEDASSTEEKAKSVVSNLSNTFELYKIETESATKEGSLIKEETRKIKNEIDQTESEIEASEEKLQSLVEELKSLKLSESKALENLKDLTENTMRKRALASKHSSVITITNFEYEYLKRRASGAEEIADKKVAAAQACIKALKASEKEILMKTEKVENEIRAQKAGDYTKQSVSSEKGGIGDKNKNTEREKMQNNSGLIRRSSTTSGKTTPARKGRHRVSVSPLVARRRAKALPNIAKLFKGNPE